MDLWSSAETLMFMSLSMVLNRTVAPASRPPGAKLCSVGQALVRSLPDLLQAALCLPSVSKGVPHSHRTSTTCSGRRSRTVAGTWTRMGAHDWRKTNGLSKVVFGNGRRMELPAVLPLVQTEGRARAPSMLPNWAVPQNHNGQGFELPS